MLNLRRWKIQKESKDGIGGDSGASGGPGEADHQNQTLSLLRVHHTNHITEKSLKVGLFGD